MPPFESSFNPPRAPSFPAPSFPVPQATADHFGVVAATAFSPQDEPDLPDPYLLRRYQAPLPLPPGVSHPPSSGSAAKQKQTPISAPAVSNRRQFEDERAARELQRLEEESARARREQEERDAELARTLDLELNFDRGGERAREGPRGPSHPPRHVGMVGDNMPGGW
ncbi:hypothetical protein BJV78DRAFT_1181456 [Lactifluus subvellereus]|nr:hypothetical protein BJV78DRAFT_1181456 [Lactifluus subvellereus]